MPGSAPSLRPFWTTWRTSRVDLTSGRRCRPREEAYNGDHGGDRSCHTAMLLSMGVVWLADVFPGAVPIVRAAPQGGGQVGDQQPGLAVHGAPDRHDVGVGRGGPGEMALLPEVHVRQEALRSRRGHHLRQTLDGAIAVADAGLMLH